MIRSLYLTRGGLESSQVGADVKTYGSSEDAAAALAAKVLSKTSNILCVHVPHRDQVFRSIDMWDPAVGFVSLGACAPPGSVLVWPHIRFSQV